MRPLSWALIIVGLVLAAMVAGKAKAAPIAEARADAVHPAGIIVLYFVDKTVAIASRSQFKLLTGV